MNSSALPTLFISILVTTFCCMPLGVVGIVFSALAMAAENTGDYAAANSHLETARTVNNIAIVLGLLLIVAFCCLGGFGGLVG